MSRGAIRGWHHGRIRATRSARARELLTKLVPAILLGAGGDRRSRCGLRPVRPLSLQPAGRRAAVLAVPGAAAIFGACWPRSWARRRRLADSSGAQSRHARCAAGCGFSEPHCRRARELDARLRAAWSRGSYEDMLDAARRFAREQIFRVGVQIVEGAAKAEQAGPAFADIAESVIAGLLPRVEAELARKRRARSGRRLCRRSRWASLAGAR